MLHIIGVGGYVGIDRQVRVPFAMDSGYVVDHASSNLTLFFPFFFYSNI